MPSDARTGARYPSSTAAPNVPQDIQNAVTDLSGVSVPRFSTTTARDNGYTSAGGAVDGNMAAVAGRAQIRRAAAWHDIAPVLSRFLTNTATGTLASAATADLVSAQTVAANPFGTSISHRVLINARVRLTLPAGLGAKVELMQDGVVFGGDEFTNGGASSITYTMKAEDIAYVTDGLSHVYRAVITALAGTITLSATYGRVYIETRPYETL